MSSTCPPDVTLRRENILAVHYQFYVYNVENLNQLFEIVLLFRITMLELCNNGMEGTDIHRFPGQCN